MPVYKRESGSMTIKSRRIIVTGGAGFIGSHLIDRLREENEVLVYDNFSNPAIKERRSDVTYFEDNILDLAALVEKTKSADVILHYAAAPSVKESSENPLHSFEQNVQGTINVLEAARKNDIPRLVFASTSTVYGEAETPTPESASLKPISNYGASKVACEMYARSYSSLYGIQAIVLRYANIFGPRANRGVMYDFFHKLKQTPKKLEILGNGKQKKSYLYIDDCIDATLASLRTKKQFDAFNIGSEEQVTVDRIAEVMSDELGLDPEFEYTGGDRGWEGDVPVMLLDVSKIKSLGWEPKVPTEEGIRKYVRWLEETQD
jgi:UDP-glucose 4-epimerase